MSNLNIVFIQACISLFFLFIISYSLINNIYFNRKKTIFGDFYIVCPLAIMLGMINLIINAYILKYYLIMLLLSLISILIFGFLAIISQQHVNLLKISLRNIYKKTKEQNNW